MTYEDALESCLQALREGVDLESVLRAFPEHEERLREDLALANQLRSFSNALPPVTAPRPAHS